MPSFAMIWLTVALGFIASAALTWATYEVADVWAAADFTTTAAACAPPDALGGDATGLLVVVTAAVRDCADVDAAACVAVVADACSRAELEIVALAAGAEASGAAATGAGALATVAAAVACAAMAAAAA